MRPPELKLTEEHICDEARRVIDAYLALPLFSQPSCPYFNNRRRKNKGGLRVLKGKGTPRELVEEALLFSKTKHTDLASLSKEGIKAFMVQHDLGVDCSGFTYHVLDALCHAKLHKSLKQVMKSTREGMFSSLITYIRPAENTGVHSFRDDKNSYEVPIGNILPGDMIIMMGTGKDKTYNHILVVTTVERTDRNLHISYAHSYQWPSDGLYDHGVREGLIITQGSNILDGEWTEKNITGKDNFTYQSALDAREVSIRRLKVF